MTTKMILDCDTGVDDTMAILYAALHPDIDLLAVGTVWGNVDVPTATRNSLHTLELVGRGDIPVAQGAAGPLAGAGTYYAYFVHGDDGQGNVYDGAPVGPAADVSAVQQIIDLVHANPGEVWLVPVGPLTNIAMALALDPELPSLVAGVSLMGGTACAPGNVSPVAEANIAHDAEAAAAVFRAPWPIVMAGLDVTMEVLITAERRTVLDEGGAVAQYLSRIMQFYGDYIGQSFGHWVATMHDSIAVAAAAGTLKVNLAPVVNVEVDTTGGPGHGQTICDLRGKYTGYPAQEGAHCTVLLDIDESIADDALALIAAYRQPGEE
jgi:purine nucleosidase